MSFSFPYLKYALGNLTKKTSCEMYPVKHKEVAPGYRGAISYDPNKCVNCGMCMKVCSPGAITRTEVEKDEGKEITYRFDWTSCTFCGMCQDFCTEKAITMTDHYEMVGNAEDLVTVATFFKKTPAGKLVVNDDCVFCSLCAKNCPEGAITVDRQSKSWSVDEEKCVKCGKCVSKCPKKALAFEKPQVKCGDDCVFCGLCAKNCPEEAITVDRANKSWSVDPEKCVLCGKCVSRCPKKTLCI